MALFLKSKRRAYHIFVLYFIVNLLSFTQKGLAQENFSQESLSHGPFHIFAAASISNALREIAPQNRQNKHVIASSGILARQITAGAPADIYISANTIWINWLKQNYHNPIIKESPLIKNRLHLVTTQNNLHHSTQQWHFPKDLSSLLDMQHTAIGHPDHVPLGSYTKQALQHFNLWKNKPKNYIFGNNALQVLQFLKAGAVDYGIVYQSDLQQYNFLKSLYKFPEKSHRVIQYQILLLTPKARALYDHLLSPKNKEVWEKYGFISLQQ